MQRAPDPAMMSTSITVFVDDLWRSQKFQGLQRHVLTEGQILRNKIALLHDRKLETDRPGSFRESNPNHLVNGRDMDSDGRFMWKEFMPQRGRTWRSLSFFFSFVFWVLAPIRRIVRASDHT